MIESIHAADGKSYVYCWHNWMRYSEKVLRICRAGGAASASPLLGTCVLAAVVVAGASLAQSQPASRTNVDKIPHLVLIPLPNLGISMQTWISRPPGAGPFPLALINHASTESPERRANLPQPRYDPLAEWFLQRGDLVAIPERPGHGRTRGPYLEDQGGCEDADYTRAGRGSAAGIEAALADMFKRSDVHKTGAVVAGHSAGGWGALALASRNPRGVAAMINFAGGRGGRAFDHANNNCAPDRLVEAARTFGSTARIPTLWIYAENDSYFSPVLARRMAEAWRAGGGHVELVVVPAFGLEGHRLAEAADGASVWGPIVAQFLAHLK
jgi:pimeloyl-ACP methyl ester carboxylesterase